MAAAGGACCLDGHSADAECPWPPTTPITTSLAAAMLNSTNASSSSLGSCGGVGSPLSARAAGAAGAAAAVGTAAGSGGGGGGWVRGLILGLLGAELAYILMDRLARLAAAHRGKAAVWHGYAWCRFRARKYYWRGRNAALRCWREWAEAEGSSSTTSEAPTTPLSSSSTTAPKTPTTPHNTTNNDWTAALSNGSTGLALCLLLPLLLALALRLTTTHLLPLLLRNLALALHTTAAVVHIHWRAGRALAHAVGAAFSLALPGPWYDVLALGGAVLLLAGRERTRHLRGDSLLAALHTQAHAAWSRLHHQRRHRKHPRRSSTSNTINPIAQWAQQLLAGYPSVLSFAREQLTAAKTLARQAEAAWAAVVDRVSWWWLLLGSGSARLGCGFGGSGGGNGEGVLVTLAELEMEWAGIALCPVRRASGECGICHERHAVLFAVSASCSHAFCRGCSANYLQTLLGSGPFPARCPSCRAEDSSPGSVSGLITRSVLKALATEGVTTPHHARRFLLQQCRAVADESTQDVLARTAKSCPNCGTATTHYRNHGCHHIKPGTGCPSCGHHWCFLCYYDSGLTWTGCANQCRLYCDNECSCPRCPDCLPGLPCAACDRDCDSCRLHA